MQKDKIEKMRIEVGHFLHDYYKKFGEEKYDQFLKKLSISMMKEYGESFSDDNLRIMEAEYVLLTGKIKANKKDTIDKKNTE